MDFTEMPVAFAQHHGRGGIDFPPGIWYSIATMYAIIETGGRQFWVAPGETIRVEKLDVEPGKDLTFKALWAVGDAKDGEAPAVSRAGTVVAQVKAQDRGPKIIVFKKRTKKAYKKTRGHRQAYTEVVIKAISLN